MRFRVVLAALFVVVITAAGIITFAGRPVATPDDRAVVMAPVDSRPARLSGEWQSPTPSTRPPTEHPPFFLVADAAKPTVQLWDEPDVPATESGVPTTTPGVLDNPTHEGLAVVFAVKDRRPGWFQVLVSSRPNGRMAWVRAEDVTLRQAPNWIRVELAARKVTVYHEDTAIMEAQIAIGKESAPTPTGSFFIDAVVKLRNPNGPYGTHQLSVSGFSDVYQQFGGGIGQIALHGTNRPEQIGQAVSHGCIRLTNEDIARMADLAPTGTPIEILP